MNWRANGRSFQSSAPPRTAIGKTGSFMRRPPAISVGCYRAPAPLILQRTFRYRPSGLGQCLSRPLACVSFAPLYHPRYNGRAIRTYEYCSDPTAKSASQNTSFVEKRSKGASRRVPILGIEFDQISQHESCLRSSALSRRGLPGRFVSPTLIPLRSPERSELPAATAAGGARVGRRDVDRMGRTLDRAALPGRVAGPDLMEALCRWRPETATGCFLLGASEETLHKLQGKLLRLCPSLSIVGSTVLRSAIS